MTASDAATSCVMAVRFVVLGVGDVARVRHHAMPAASTAIAAMPIAMGARRVEGARGGAAADSALVESEASTASMPSGRSAGSFARQRAISARTPGVTSAAVMAGAGVAICAAVIAAGVVRSANGCAPCSSSYASTPHA